MLKIKIKNLDKLVRGLREFPPELKTEIGKAIMKSAYLVEGKSKPITPVLTGQLRGSIASKFSSFQAIIQPNKEYAIYVHENLTAHHPVGEAKFMEKGAKQAEPQIQREFQGAINNVIRKKIK